MTEDIIDAVTKAITEAMLEESNGKLEVADYGGESWLEDSDSNWAFYPRDIAKVAIVAYEAAWCSTR